MDRHAVQPRREPRHHTTSTTDGERRYHTYDLLESDPEREFLPTFEAVGRRVWDFCTRPSAVPLALPDRARRAVLLQSRRVTLATPL